jgi:protein involved in polysaccharide export with SLBB domain
MRRIFLILPLLLVLLHPGAAGAQSPASAADAGLRPGDVVRIAAWRLPEFSGEFRVAADGGIQHPLLTEVRVLGVSEEVIMQRLLSVIRRYETDPQVVVDLLYRVAVGGEVQQPNVLLVPPETTVSQAVALAAGTNQFGTLERVTLFRDGTAQRLNLHRPDPDVLSMRVRSGDEIRVGRRVDFFRDNVVPVAAVVSALLAVVSFFR